MIYIAILPICISALLFCREYISYMDKRLSECEAFLLFVRHIRTEVACFMKPPAQLCEGFDSETLSRLGFKEALSSGKGLAEAYSECEPSLALAKEERLVLRELFSYFGSGYLDESVRLLDTSESRLSEAYAELRGECPRRKKLAISLSACAVLGFIILVI